MKIFLNSNFVTSTKRIKNNLDFIPIQTLVNGDININSLRLVDIINQYLYNKIEPIGKIERFLNVYLEVQKFQYNDSYYSSTRGYHLLFNNHSRLNHSYNCNYKKQFYSSDGLIVANFIQGSLNRSRLNPPTILYNLCVKKEYVRYFLQCVLLNKDIDHRIFVLLIDKDFDTTSTFAPRVRPQFRKYIRKSYLELGIELKYESNLDELLFTTYKIEASTPMELKQIKKDLVQELLTI